MKNHILYFLVFLCFKSYCQIPNSGFENWTSTSSYTVPIGWSTSGFGADSTSDVASGNKALLLWTWYTYAYGYAYNGQDGIFFDFYKAGTPCTQKATALTGMYKFDTTHVFDKDSAVVMVLLKKYNTSFQKVDTIGFALHKLPPVNSYTPFTVPIADFMPTENPDSIVIVFSTQKRLFDLGSAQNTCQSPYNDCAYFYIDDIALSIPNGIIEISDLFDGKTFPNPSQSQVKFKYNDASSDLSDKLFLYDNQGRLCHEEKITPGTIVNTSGFQNGLYHYIVFSKEKKVLIKGKFVVAN